jgi:hypothetical protein
MSPGVIIAIGIGVATALVMGLLAARQAGEARAEERYGRELDARPTIRGRRPIPGMRQRAMVAIIGAAIAALGAGIAVGLGNGNH